MSQSFFLPYLMEYLSFGFTDTTQQVSELCRWDSGQRWSGCLIKRQASNSKSFSLFFSPPCQAAPDALFCLRVSDHCGLHCWTGLCVWWQTRCRDKGRHSLHLGKVRSPRPGSFKQSIKSMLRGRNRSRLFLSVAGCPRQPLLSLTNDGIYDMEGKVQASYAPLGFVSFQSSSSFCLNLVGS